MILPAPPPILAGPRPVQLQTLKTSNTWLQPPDSARLHVTSRVIPTAGPGVASAAPEQLSGRGRSGWA